VETLGLVLFVVGMIISLVGSIWFLVVAFKESLLWGLGCLIVPFVGLFFLISHWNEAAKPFGISFGGGLLMVIGIALMGPQQPVT
jgi:hypothetical protein